MEFNPFKKSLEIPNIDQKTLDVSFQKSILNTIELQSKEITIQSNDKNEKGKLLASPSGPVSKLSEQEWKMIRTQEFKEWSKGNKLIDEDTGEPIVLYHGSTKRFSEFNIEKTGSTTGNPAGIFLTDNKKIAKGYYSTETGNFWENLKLQFGLSKHKPGVYSCFAKVENPFIYDFDRQKNNPDRIEIVAKAIKEGYDSAFLKNIIDGPSVKQNVYVIFNDKNILIEKVE